MTRGLRIVLVFCLSLMISATLMQCGGGHSNGVSSSNAPASGGASNSSVTLSSITVTPSNPSLILASGTTQTQQFTATGIYSDNSTKNLTASVIWSSSSTSVATITSGGNATILAYGATNISATFGSISGSTALTVVSTASLKSIQVTPLTPSILVGASQQFIAQGTNIDGTIQNLTASVTWASSLTAVATISNTPGSNGRATSVAAGQTTITAALGSLTGSTILTVTSPIQNPLAFTTPQVGLLPASIAIDINGNVWVSDYDANTVSELFNTAGNFVGASNSVYEFPSVIGASPFGIAIDYLGNIWTANYDSNNITVIILNPAPFNATTCPNGWQGTGSEFIVFGSRNGIGNGPHGIAIDAQNNVWISNYGTPSAPGSTITELTPDYIDYFCSTGLSPYSVSVKAIATYSVGGTNPYSIALDAQGNAWVSNYGSNTVSELTPAGALLNIYPVGSGPRGIAIDPPGNVWVANSGTDAAPGNTVTMINPAGGTTTNYTVGTGPHSIAIETSGNVWVTNFGTTVSAGNTITELVFNSKGNNYNLTSPANTLSLPYTVGNHPEGIAIDFSGNVWVTNYTDDTLTVWKGATQGPHWTPYSGPIWPE